MLDAGRWIRGADSLLLVAGSLIRDSRCLHFGHRLLYVEKRNRLDLLVVIRSTEYPMTWAVLQNPKSNREKYLALPGNLLTTAMVAMPQMDAAAALLWLRYFTLVWIVYRIARNLSQFGL